MTAVLRALRDSSAPRRAVDAELLAASPWTLTSAGLLWFMLLPVSQNAVNAAVLLAGLVAACVSLVRHGWRMSAPVTVAAASALLAGAVAGAVGLLHGNAGVRQELVFFVVVPVVLVLMVAGSPARVLGSGLAMVPVGMTALGALALLYYASARGWIPLPENMFAPLGAGGAGQVDTSVPELSSRLRFYAIPTLAFGLPFLVGVVALDLRFASRASRLCVWPGLLLCAVFLLVSGRRAVIVSCVLAAVVVVVLSIVARLRSRSTEAGHEVAGALRRALALAVAAVVVVLTSMVITSGGVAGGGAGGGGPAVVGGGGAAVQTGPRPLTPGGIVSSLAEPADSPRPVSQDALVRGFRDSPVLGQGLGYVADVVRNPDAPWQYEAQYHLMLAALGIVPGALLLLPTLWLLVVALTIGLARTVACRSVLAVLAGTGSILLANYSNPYLHTAGQYWMFFILVFAVDEALRRPQPVDTGEVLSRGSSADAGPAAAPAA